MAFLTRWQDDPTRPTAREAARDLVVRALGPIALWWLVVLAIGWLLTDGPLTGLGSSEEGINRTLASSRTAVLNDVTLVFSWTGATVSVIAVCLVTMGAIWWRTRQWWFAIVPLVAISLQALVFFLTTLLIDRQRPDVPRLADSPPTSSYPSGHTGAATALYVTLALLALRIRNPTVRAVVVAVCLAVPLLVGSSRLCRGMHHLTDVVVAAVDGVVAVGPAGVGLATQDRPGGAPDPGHGGVASDAGEARSGEGVDPVASRPRAMPSRMTDPAGRSRSERSPPSRPVAFPARCCTAAVMNRTPTAASAIPLPTWPILPATTAHRPGCSRRSFRNLLVQPL